MPLSTMISIDRVDGIQGKLEVLPFSSHPSKGGRAEYILDEHIEKSKGGTTNDKLTWRTLHVLQTSGKQIKKQGRLHPTTMPKAPQAEQQQWR
jgi:hypothetical protein